jgi:sodium transport system permease protein
MSARILNIWRKELLDNFRDRKGLIQSILIPLLFGIFYAVFDPILNDIISRRAADPIIVPALGLEYATQDLIDVLALVEITLVEYEGDLAEAVRRAEEEAGLIFPEDFRETVETGGAAPLILLTNPTAGGLIGGFSSERLEITVSVYNDLLAQRRLQTRDLDPELVTPIVLDIRNLATPEQLGGVFAAISLPVLLGFILTIGGLYIAIDVTAGEKERGTLESVLVTPASDLEVLLGKLMAVFSMTLIPLVLTFIGFWAASNLLSAFRAEDTLLPFTVVLYAIGVGMPLALFINVATMILSVRTRSFKDAQSAATPLTLGVTLGALAAAFVIPSNVLAYLIPIYGSCAVIGRLASGAVVPAGAVALSIAGSLIAAVIGFMIAVILFDRERMLYGG